MAHHSVAAGGAWIRWRRARRRYNQSTRFVKANATRGAKARMCPTSVTTAIPPPTRVSAINIANRTRSGRCGSSTPAVSAQTSPAPHQPCPRCGTETATKARGRPRRWRSDRCRKLASEEHRAAARGAIGLEIRDRIIERRIPETVHRPPSITSSIALLLSDVAASKKVPNTLARRVKRDQLDRATIKLLWPHIHELYTEARPRMGLPERPTTVRTMTPAKCAERVLGWPRTGVQVINGLTAKAQAGHLSPAEHRDLSTAITHLSDALTTTPSD